MSNVKKVVQFWELPNGGLSVYVSDHPENKTLLDQLSDIQKPNAHYWNPNGFHWVFGNKNAVKGLCSKRELATRERYSKSQI
jgi:hypothetical protein